MEPEEWDQAVLDAVGLTIVTVGTEGTCKTSGGSKQIDYLLVSTDLVPLIEDLKLEADVPWSPHAALSFSVNRRPEKVFHQAMAKPAPLPYVMQDKGKASP